MDFYAETFLRIARRIGRTLHAFDFPAIAFREPEEMSHGATDVE